MYSYSLIPLILRPTRITNKSETLIDNIFTNDSINNISGILMLDTSDHLPNFSIAETKINLKSNNHQKNFRDFSNTNIRKLKTCMTNFNWKDSIKMHDNVNDAYNNFIEIFNSMLDKFVPLKKKSNKTKTKSKLPWIAKDLIKMINKKNRFYKQYMNKRTQQSKTKYKTLKNKVNKLLRTAKKNYYSDQLKKEKNNIKNTWKILNNVLNKDHKRPCHTEFNLNGKIINNSNQIPDHFNDFFINIGPNQVSQIPDTNTHFSTYLSNPTQNSMLFTPITEDEVIEVINNLDAKKSAGHDNISILIIKKLATELSTPLTDVFNMSLDSGIKTAKVTSQITGQFQFYPVSQKFLKDWFSIDAFHF